MAKDEVAPAGVPETGPSALVTGAELDELRAQVERDFGAGDHERVLALISVQGPAIWYGLRPERFRAILETVIRSGSDSNALAEKLRLFVTAGDRDQFPLEMIPALLGENDPALAFMGRMARMLDLRLRGHADVAVAALDELSDQALSIHPLFDTRAGWQLLLSLQCGITAMLAGSFSQALVYFSAAQTHVLVPTLVFLNRDAHVKTALIHVFFGDIEQARAALEDASQYPRTSSWIEPLLDSHALIVQSQLEADPRRALELLESIPLRDIGEMWPFYVMALQRLLTRAGRPQHLKERVSLLERLGFPRTEGESFTGSVFALARTAASLLQNDLEASEFFILQADETYFGTRLAEARLLLNRGQARKAVKIVQASRQESDLRQVHLRRQSLLAEGFLELGRTDEALDCLRSAMSIDGGVRATDLGCFSRGVIVFAEQHFSDWPKSETAGGAAQSPGDESTSARITIRERDILRLLATGATRTQIADELFISMNTLKFHLKQIYKKLEVTTREAAVLRGEIEGWI